MTAPAGTVLATVAGALATTATAVAASAAPASGGGATPPEPAPPQESVAVYAGTQRLDPQRQVIGEPPLVDGAVISLHGPAAALTAVSAYGPAKARLHVVAGPDAGGIHLLQGGRVHLGRSAEADVPVDDPDVSRTHCAVTVTDGGAVSVTDLGSTNGTTIDGGPVGTRPVLFRPGSVLRLGETAFRLEAAGPPRTPESGSTALPAPLRTVAEGQGTLRLVREEAEPPLPPAPLSPVPAPPEPPPAPGAPVSAPLSAPGPPGHPPGEPFPASAEFDEPAVTRRSSTVRRPTRPSDEGEARRSRGIGAWARRLGAGQGEAAPREGRWETPSASDTARGGGAGHPAPPGLASAPPPPDAAALAAAERWPDPAAVLLTALGPGPLLWRRDPGDRDALSVRVGGVPREDGGTRPLTVDLRAVGALGLAGPRPRLAGLARAVLAQLAAWHGPNALEIVLLSADPRQPVEERAAEWSWLGWLPHLRPGRGQHCRLLLAYDAEQARARVAELVRRVVEERRSPADAGAEPRGPRTLLVVDGDPGADAIRTAVGELAAEGGATGVHLLRLAETPPATPNSPVEEGLLASVGLADCGAVAVLSGDVATAVRLIRRDGARAGAPEAARIPGGPPRGTLPAGPSRPGAEPPSGPIATADGVSAAWAERFARALAPLREPDAVPGEGAASGAVAELPRSCRLLDELGLARATPTALLARWSPVAEAVPGRAALVLGAGPRGPVEAELSAARGHALITGAAGAGKTELLRSLAASLAAGERPARLGLLLVDGRVPGAEGEGLRICAELPHVTGHLTAGDPLRMREFAQALTAELKRRAQLIGGGRTYEQYARHETAPPDPVERPAAYAHAGGAGRGPAPLAAARPAEVAGAAAGSGGTALAGRPDGPGGERPDGGEPLEAEPLPRLVVLVDDLDTLVDPALGNPGRPAAGSVVRALESVAREGARLGVHLVASTGHPEGTEGTALAHVAFYRVDLSGGAEAEAEVPPGRGVFNVAAESLPFQAGRITGRIPRTATLRPTVVPLDWARAGDPPSRRPVRELGNGPTDLALLASAVGRAARSTA
ncbi:FHA domain-containing protein [Streptomyces sp. AJS327]|uniref:FHA domain-containing protein n=1 Tax=Streptomyces sp. AJS327 TaxID=2545265 RepID=UPI0027E54850|nr:FHA domain-containing protein [Streptomyces sp. AJS327]